MPKVRAELISDVSQIAPGATFRVVLHLKMPSQWHTYYVNPGESGRETRIKWSLPTGFTAGPIQWPLPKRLVVGGVSGYVYEEDAYLSTEFTAPKNIKPGETVSIRARADWLICRDACVPQGADLQLALPVEKSAKVIKYASRIAGSRQLQAGRPKVEAQLVGHKVVLAVFGNGFDASSTDFFPSDAAFFGADRPKISKLRSGHGAMIELPVSSHAVGRPTHISGVLWSRSRGANWIDTTIQ